MCPSYSYRVVGSLVALVIKILTFAMYFNLLSICDALLNITHNLCAYVGLQICFKCSLFPYPNSLPFGNLNFNFFQVSTFSVFGITLVMFQLNIVSL
jgi:hypothetical protein